MALTWNLSGIKDFDSVCKHPTKPEQMNPYTNGLIWYCLALGMPGISKANIEEFATRMTMRDKLFGTILVDETPSAKIDKDDKTKVVPMSRDVAIPYEEVERHIGLSTNVSLLSRSQFLKNLFENVRRDLKREVNRAVEVKNEVPV